MIQQETRREHHNAYDCHSEVFGVRLGLIRLVQNKLERALRKVFNMVREDAVATASVVETAFNGEDEVNDEDLDKDIRSLFYQLEKENLLQVRRTEYKFEGQIRRAYFWRMRRLDEANLDDFGSSFSKEDLEATKLYRQLPQELWARKPG